MAMRLTGMQSGLDTESIIQELVAARRTKVDKIKKDQTRMEWKQDAWKDLNKKIKSFQNKYVSNMRLSSAFAKKVTKVSNSNAVSVITSDGAPNGTQSLRVDRLAKAGFLTGKEISNNGSKVTALTKVSDLIGDENFESGKLQLQVGSKTPVDINVDQNTTISDVLTQLKDAGVNASFDEKQQRFFINSKDTGAVNNFTLTAGEGGAEILSALGLDTNDGAKKVDGQDARIFLNDAEFTSKSNVFEINGLTITALAETQPGESISLTTERDTSGIYDMLKDFLKEYNALINEMDKLYNAESAKGYDPLTDEEKEDLSEKEIEKWETKIKDSILRRDSELSSISSAFKQIMSDGYTVNGRKMYLSDFGINTLGYFNAADNEKNAYHIDGDPDDENTSANEDKLRSMIAKDPDSVVSFFTQLSNTLYDKMFDMSRSQDGYRSFGSFFDDKKMKSDYDSYTSKIAAAEKKLNDYEDKWYKKFSKMETALAKMQSNANAVTGLFGGSN